MGRALIVVTLAGAGLVLGATPALAHPGIENPFVPAHVATAVVLGVPSEEASPMVEIDVTLPADFTLQRVDSVPGWQSDSGPGRLRFFNGRVAQGGYAQFLFAGVFARKRVISVPVLTRAADGTSVNWDGPPGTAHPATLVFPGYPPNAVAPGPSNGGPGPLALAAVAATLAVLGLGLVLLRRSRVPGAVKG